MPNQWDEPYCNWLQARAAYKEMLPLPVDCKDEELNRQCVEAKGRYETAWNAFFEKSGPVIKRAATFTAQRFPSQINAAELIALFNGVLVKRPPKELNEAIIRKALRRLALNAIKEVRGRKDEIPLEPDRDGEDNKATGTADLPTNRLWPRPMRWPWYESLSEPSRGYGALWSHIQELADIKQEDAFAQTGWFSGVSGEGVRSKMRREAELNPSKEMEENDFRRLNAAMLGAHSVLTIALRTLCPKATTASTPFLPEIIEEMSRVTRRAPEPAVAQWVIDCLSGTTASVPDLLRRRTQRILTNKADAEDVRYFLGCVRLYLRAYSILVQPVQGDAAFHWTTVGVPMTPREAAFPDYRTRATDYGCLKPYLA